MLEEAKEESAILSREDLCIKMLKNTEKRDNNASISNLSVHKLGQLFVADSQLGFL